MPVDVHVRARRGALPSARSPRAVRAGVGDGEPRVAQGVPEHRLDVDPGVLGGQRGADHPARVVGPPVEPPVHLSCSGWRSGNARPAAATAPTVAASTGETGPVGTARAPNQTTNA